MNWISGIQQSINFVEERMTEKIEYEEVAKKAYSSLFHFQRIFTMLCGFSIADYVRMRRLSLAAEELYQTQTKIIDIAFKYGYDTPESFTRAFTRFHGIVPSEARRGGAVKSFSRLSVKLILTGGNSMDYRIEAKDAIKLICKRKHVNKPQGETAAEDISAFWKECNQNNTIKTLCEYANFDNLHGILGICFSNEMTKDGFPYGIGAEYNGKPLVDKDFDIIELPAQTYAIFQCRGAMPDAFVQTYNKIVTEFFTQSNYEYGFGIEMEVYPSVDVQDPNYYCEIWIAVNEKRN